MDFIWHLLLTVCASGTCIEQDIQWFQSQIACETTLVHYAEIPPDGDWDSVEYVCKPVGSKAT